MGRRKKEPIYIHREHIAQAAQTLFQEKGSKATSMDEIAKAAGYSKATLYVYFKNKEEIMNLLAFQSMETLYTYISNAIDSQEDIKFIYKRICFALLTYQKTYPFYFDLCIQNLNMNVHDKDCTAEELQTYQVGERINQKLVEFIQKGIDKQVFRNDIKLLPLIFSLWGMLSGLIQLGIQKESYLQDDLQITIEELYKTGFDMLYQSIERRA